MARAPTSYHMAMEAGWAVVSTRRAVAIGWTSNSTQAEEEDQTKRTMYLVKEMMLQSLIQTILPV